MDALNKRQKTLDGFVRISSLPSNPANKEEPSCSNIEIPDISEEKPFIHENDIGPHLKEVNHLSDLKIKELVENPFVPPKNYTFPYSEHNKNNKIVKRYLNQSHLDKYSWIVYSPSMKGLFCKSCALFSYRLIDSSKFQDQLGILVTKPLTKFAKLLEKDGDLEKHQLRDYHRKCIELENQFLDNFNKPDKEIINMINANRLKQIQENRKKLIPIIDTVITMGKQNISFRGHRDDGSLLNNSTEENEGNFCEILKLRIRAGDKVLTDHLMTANANSTYISKTTQNAIIECCGEEILDTIKMYLREANYYSVMFDETTDNYTVISELSISIRCVHQTSVREDFIRFFDLHEMNYNSSETNVQVEPKISGKMLGQSVLKVLREKSFNLDFCVGVCTDTCSVMMSEDCGAVTEILQSAKHAVRISCYNHLLNLSVSNCMKVKSARNCFGVMKEVTTFFHKSGKRSFALKQLLKGKLSKFSDTRWIERHDTTLFFEDNLVLIVQTLESIETWQDQVSSSKASIFLKSLLTSEFLVSIKCISHFFTLTLPLCNLFQNKSLDIQCANDLVKDLLSVLESERENADKVYKSIFQKTASLASSLNVELAVPRLVGLQRHRSNYSSDTPEDYFRISVFIPILDQLLFEIKNRFNPETMDALALNVLLPEQLLAINDENLKIITSKLWHKYKDLLSQCNINNTEECLYSEVILWKAKCNREFNNTTELSVQDVLKNCNKTAYPNCNILLRILLSLPSSVASSERSFSALRRLRDWLRNRMSEERLTGLALLHMHRNINLNPYKVLDRFASSKKRRLDLIL